jgi:predicted GTPase
MSTSTKPEIRQEINIVMIGPVSAGKSTLTNALFVAQYSDARIKRTTALPQVYYETDCTDGIDDPTGILEINRAKNKEIMDKTIDGKSTLTIDDVKEVSYIVPLIHDLFEERKKDVFYTVYDLPGLNDSRTNTVYYEYVKQNFYKFDIVLFVLDIKNALNTSDEMEMLKTILNHMKTNKNVYDINTKLVVLLNKCDEIEIRNGKPEPQDEEICEMLQQAECVIKTQVNEIHATANVHITCVAMEDAYIYRSLHSDPTRMLDVKCIDKLGINECGKRQWAKKKPGEKHTSVVKIIDDLKRNNEYRSAIALTGFTYFKKIMNEVLTHGEQFMYLLNHTKYALSQIKDPIDWDIKKSIDDMFVIRVNIMCICSKYGKTAGRNVKLVDERLEEYITRYNTVNSDNGLQPMNGVIPESKYNAMKSIRGMYEYIVARFKGTSSGVKEQCGPDNYEELLTNISNYRIKQLENDNISEDDFLTVIYEHAKDGNAKGLITSIHDELPDTDTVIDNAISRVCKYEFKTQCLIMLDAICTNLGIDPTRKIMYLCNYLIDWVTLGVSEHNQHEYFTLKRIQLKNHNPFYKYITDIQQIYTRKYTDNIVAMVEAGKYTCEIGSHINTQQWCMGKKLIATMQEVYPDDITITDL